MSEAARFTILVVDDEDAILRSLSGALDDEGYRVLTAASGEDALARLDADGCDLMLLDVWMPGIDGLDVLERVRKTHPRLPVIVMSGHGRIETAVRATKLGAYDFVEKPLSLDKVILTIEHALETGRLAEENQALKAEIERRYELVGASPEIEDLREQIRTVAPTNGWVLITGENGTGKELVARAIHRGSPRAGGPFVEVNCAAIPEDLIESELFGHERGAFTGADRRRAGAFERADSGTLFLDEIGDMSLKTQAKILRALQERKFTRVGGTEVRTSDVRVIAATNKDLAEEIEAGRFREDLFYRLNVVPIEVPPLRQRREDIPLLVRHFQAEFCRAAGRPLPETSPEALEMLADYDWPGNVRELKNVVERIGILSKGQRIEATDVPLEVARAAGGNGRPGGPDSGLDALLDLADIREARAAFEKAYLERKLAENGGNVSRTAEAVGLERTNLHRKLKAYGLTANPKPRG